MKDNELITGFTDNAKMDILFVAAMSQIKRLRVAIESALHTLEIINNATESYKDNKRNGTE